MAIILTSLVDKFRVVVDTAPPILMWLAIFKVITLYCRVPGTALLDLVWLVTMHILTYPNFPLLGTYIPLVRTYPLIDGAKVSTVPAKLL